MGIVYLGRDPVIGRLVALKTIRATAEDDAEQREFGERFLREAQAAGILSHPNIVTIHDVGEDPETHVSFIAMEYVEGKNVKQLLQEKTVFPYERIAEIIGQVAEALDYAHRRGIVHRDVKPANIIITSEGAVKITDFGIAKIEKSNLTSTGQFLGTPNYMSPEQVTGEAVDGRSDLFSLAVVLYELLTRKKPFSGDNLTSISYKIVHETFTPPESYDAGVPSEFNAILTKALAKDPASRYQRGNDFALALYEFKARQEEREMLADLGKMVAEAERLGPVSAVDSPPPTFPATPPRQAPAPRAEEVATVFLDLKGAGRQAAGIEPLFGDRPPGTVGAGAPSPAAPPPVVDSTDPGWKLDESVKPAARVVPRKDDVDASVPGAEVGVETFEREQRRIDAIAPPSQAFAKPPARPVSVSLDSGRELTERLRPADLIDFAIEEPAEAPKPSPPPTPAPVPPRPVVASPTYDPPTGGEGRPTEIIFDAARLAMMGAPGAAVAATSVSPRPQATPPGVPSPPRGPETPPSSRPTFPPPPARQAASVEVESRPTEILMNAAELARAGGPKSGSGVLAAPSAPPPPASRPRTPSPAPFPKPSRTVSSAEMAPPPVQTAPQSAPGAAPPRTGSRSLLREVNPKYFFMVLGGVVLLAAIVVGILVGKKSAVQDKPDPAQEANMREMEERRKLLDDGNRQLAAGQPEEALKSFRELIRRAPDSPAYREAVQKAEQAVVDKAAQDAKLKELDGYLQAAREGALTEPPDDARIISSADLALGLDPANEEAKTLKAAAAERLSKKAESEQKRLLEAERKKRPTPVAARPTQVPVVAAKPTEPSAPPTPTPASTTLRISFQSPVAKGLVMVGTSEKIVFRKDFDLGKNSRGGPIEGSVMVPSGSQQMKVWVIASDRSVNQYVPVTLTLPGGENRTLRLDLDSAGKLSVSLR